MSAQDEDIGMMANALVRKAGSVAGARSLLQLMDDYPDKSIDELVRELKRARYEDVK